MKLLLSIAFLLVMHSAMAQKADIDAIRQVLSNQEAAWNNGDIDAFMNGYWNSDSLLFIGSKGVTYGYQNTLNRYKTGYNSTEKMGRLKFDLLHFIPISADCWMVIGKWQLTRTIGDAGGHFSLVFRRIKGQWVITSDHTS